MSSSECLRYITWEKGEGGDCFHLSSAFLRGLETKKETQNFVKVLSVFLYKGEILVE